MEAADDAGELTHIGCIGPFEIASTDAADRSEVLYLRAGGETQGGDVYRYEAAVTFGVEQEITGRPQVIAAEEQGYRLVEVWQRSIYSSTSVILFAEDPEDRSPEIFYAVNVFTSPVGDVVGEYRLSGQNEQPSEDVVTAAEEVGLHPDLTVEGQRYLLVSVYTPVGTTTNGFVTLFSASGEGDAEMLLGRDLQTPGVVHFQRNSTTRRIGLLRSARVPKVAAAGSEVDDNQELPRRNDRDALIVAKREQSLVAGHDHVRARGDRRFNHAVVFVDVRHTGN